jgi:hypothetical protein
MVNGLSQIVIEKSNKNNFQVWKFNIMDFLMEKGYWEFINIDEKKPPFKKPPHNNKFKLTKLGMRKLGKFCINFL